MENEYNKYIDGYRSERFLKIPTPILPSSRLPSRMLALRTARKNERPQTERIAIDSVRENKSWSHITLRGNNLFQNRYYIAGVGALPTDTNFSVTANRIYAVPFLTGDGGKIDRISIYVESLAIGGATDSAYVAIYSNMGNGKVYPYSRIVGLPEKVLTAGTLVEWQFLHELRPNHLVWFAVIFNDSTTIRGMSTAGEAPLGYDNALVNPAAGLTYSMSYGVLPDIFPSNASIQSSNIPKIGIRMFS